MLLPRSQICFDFSCCHLIESFDWCIEYSIYCNIDIAFKYVEREGRRH